MKMRINCVFFFFEVQLIYNVVLIFIANLFSDYKTKQ